MKSQSTICFEQWTLKKMCGSKKHQVCGIVPTDSTVERERAIINWEVLRFSLPISLRLLHFVSPTLKTDSQRDEAWCIFWRLSRWTCQFCGSWVECCHGQGQWKNRQRRLNSQIHLLVPKGTTKRGIWSTQMTHKEISCFEINFGSQPMFPWLKVSFSFDLIRPRGRGR